MRISVYLLCAAQAATVTVAVLSVTISADLGKMLSGAATWSTVPYGIQFLALLAGAMPMSILCLRLGRKPVLALAAVLGMIGCLLAASAVHLVNFKLFCLAHVFIGLGLGAGNYYRFCAVELTDEFSKASAMSLIMSAGVVAALLGPAIPRAGWTFGNISTYSLMYLIGGGLFLASCIAVLATKMPASEALKAGATATKAKMRDFPPGWILGISSGALGYLFMNLLMIEYPMQSMKSGMSLNVMSYMVELHVLGMFLPSFFSGLLIKKFGCRPLIIVGAGLLVFVVLLPLLTGSILARFSSLIALGVSWNFLYIAGSHLVSSANDARVKAALQGWNEFVVGLAAMAGAFLPGFSIGLGGTGLVSFLAITSALFLTICACKSLPVAAMKKELECEKIV